MTSFTYDILGRTLVTTDRTNKPTTRVYDSAGRLWKLTDAENRTTEYAYDLMGRKTSTTYPDTSVTTINYDPSGSFPTGSTAHKVTFQTGKSHTSITSFDGTLDKIEFRNAGGTLTGTDDFSYDTRLRKSGSTSADGITRAWTYTDRNQIATEATTFGGQTYTVTYTYDARDRVIDIIYPSTRKASYTYTTRSELDLVKWQNTQFENRAYDTAGRLTSIDRPFTDEARTYDNAQRLLTINNTPTVGQMTYTWDANSNKLTETWTGAMANWSFTTQKTGASFPTGYDEEDRFRRFIRTGQSSDIYLARSDIGNISDLQTNGNSALRSYSPAHELTNVSAATQTFDDDGNLTAGHTGVGLSWNDAQRVTGSTLGAISTTYKYDSDGKRISKRVMNGAATVEDTVYIHAGPNVVAEYNYSAAPASPVQEYVYGLEIDSLSMIVRNSGNDKLIVTRNQQWSVVSLCDNANGSVLERYSYDQFGKRTILAPDGVTVRTTSSYTNPWGYTSRYHDSESGLMFFRARYYDPSTAEFTSRDPLEYVDGMSVYRGDLGSVSMDPAGTTKCLGKPEGIVYSPRGQFENVWLSDYDGSDDNVKRLGSAIFVSWRSHSEEFTDAVNCCCCDLVGFVQVVSNKYSYADVIDSVEGNQLVFEVDGGIPYGESTQNNPCRPNIVEDEYGNELPDLGRSIRLNDMPNGPLQGGPFTGFRKLKSLQQDFLTCAVCLSGDEGPGWTPIGKDPSGVLGIRSKLLNGLTVYGCIKWGHRLEATATYRRQGDSVYHFSIVRYLMGETDRGLYSSSSDKVINVNPDGLTYSGPGVGPDSGFSDAVLGHTTTY